MRGQLILIEGLDRSGKSTQAQILSDRLNATLIRFPNRVTPIGSVINQYLVDPDFQLSDQAAHLLFLANRWESAQSIVDDLAAGRSVVMDRYIYSGIAYSLAKLRGGQSSPQLDDIEWLYSPDRGLPRPDITLFLTLSLKELGGRKGWGEERYEKEEFQKKVRESFELVFERQGEGHTICSLDVDNLSIEDVSALVWQTLVRANKIDKTASPLAWLD